MSCDNDMSCQVGVGILLVYTAGAGLYWRYTATLPLAVYLLLAAGVPSSHHHILANTRYISLSPQVSSLCPSPPSGCWDTGGRRRRPGRLGGSGQEKGGPQVI